MAKKQTMPSVNSRSAEEQATVEIQAALERNGCELRARITFETGGKSETQIVVVKRGIDGSN